MLLPPAVEKSNILFTEFAVGKEGTFDRDDRSGSGCEGHVGVNERDEGGPGLAAECFIALGSLLVVTCQRAQHLQQRDAARRIR